MCLHDVLRGLWPNIDITIVSTLGGPLINSGDRKWPLYLYNSIEKVAYSSYLLVHSEYCFIDISFPASRFTELDHCEYFLLLLCSTLLVKSCHFDQNSGDIPNCYVADFWGV